MGYRNPKGRGVACDLAPRPSLEAAATNAASADACAKQIGPGAKGKRSAKHLYIMSQPPTKHSMPPAGAMQFVSRETKESRTGVIVVIFRATFVGGFPCEAASHQAGEYSFPVVVRLHRIAPAAGERAVRTRARLRSILQATEVGVEGPEGGQESRAMSSSFVAEHTRYWRDEFEWQADRSLCWIKRMAPRRRGGPSLAHPVASAWPQLHARGSPSLLQPWTTSLL